MTAIEAVTARDWPAMLRPDDLVVVAQGVGEPTPLLEQLLAAEAGLTDVEVFLGLSHSTVLSTPRSVWPRIVSFGAMGPLAALARTGDVAVIPCHFVDVPRLLLTRAVGRLVVLIQVSAADADGRHSLSMSVDYTYELLDAADLVVAEVNERLPVTTAPKIAGTDLDVVVKTSRPLPEISNRRWSETHRRIAGHVAGLVPDGATLQLGVGALAAAVGEALRQRRDLSVHSPLVGNWLVELSNAGALREGPGAVSLCEAAGSAELYDLVASGAGTIRSVSELNRPDTMANLPCFVAVNSALQVDLSGQVNAEELQSGYVGGIGGQADLLRAAQRSSGGRAIVMLPANTGDGRSRIVASLDTGTVSTPRATVDFVVTEYGVADLRGRALSERAAALVAVAAPEHRPFLSARSEVA